ncbi:alpha/beta hydrolase [Photobacterium sp. TLY01]|uniref:alpha/beta hydrolase n=1 Tax=Photobacterium sp. TLY01 TaxID=2907534 RepID=UPI001F302F66|nr:acyl-CoA thioester hydrolase/BAAT C-terminal domain-containing protein [Photobacterium sp. TLY01]UIP30404.1 prolyl oligopeptidase family serine peptidase [Photobacterium sp. TLY01]
MLKPLLFVVTAVCSVVPSPVLSRVTEELRRSDGSDITYYLSGRGSDRLLVLIQGSDCNSVFHNQNINDNFSRVMDDADTLTVEKYGIDNGLSWNTDPQRADCPDAYLKQDSPSQRVADYLTVLDKLDQDNRYSQIVLLEGSEGALVANLLAAKSDKVTGVVALNGGGRFFIDDVLYNMQSQMSPQAFSEAEQGFRQFAEAVLQSNEMDTAVSGHGFKWWKAMLTADQQQILQTIDVPVLLIQSEEDTNVDPHAFESMVRALKKTAPHIQPRTYAGLDHAFNDAQGQSQVERVLDDIKVWIGSGAQAKN